MTMLPAPAHRLRAGLPVIMALAAAFFVINCAASSFPAASAQGVALPTASSPSLAEPPLFVRVCFINDATAKPQAADITLTSVQTGQKTTLSKDAPSTGCTPYPATTTLLQGDYNLAINVTGEAPFQDTVDFVSVNATHFTYWYNQVDQSGFPSSEGAYDPQELNFAYVRVLFQFSQDVTVLVRNTNCFRCANSVLAQSTAGAPLTQFVKIQTDFPEELSVCLTSSTGPNPCATPLGSANQTYFFGERGFYTIIVRDLDTLVIQTDIEGTATHGTPKLPILYTFVIIVGLFILWAVPQNCCYRVVQYYPRFLVMNPNNNTRQYGLVNAEKRPVGTSQKTTHAIGNPKTSTARLRSLDSFRGTALTIMIFVNYGGGMYNFFDHSKWNGLTVADLVFPWFVWIMGTSMAIAFNSLFKRNTAIKTFLYKIFRRSILLFVIGVVFINTVFNLDMARVPGVLQRFAISYLVVALLIVFVPKAPSLHISSGPNQSIPLIDRFNYGKAMAVRDLGDYRPRSIVRLLNDVAPYLLEWTVMLLLVAVYLCLTFLLPVPGCPTGYIGPGGSLAEFGRFKPEDGSPCVGGTFCCEGGAAGHIDRWVLGWKHIYKSPTSKDTYGSGAYDPEGILGSITSAFICYLGLQAGKIIVHYKEHGQRIKRFIIWGVLCCAIATALCGASQNDGVIPLSKNLWSLSFVLMMAGFGFLALTVFYILIDVYGVWTGAPFRFVGLNSIFIYVFHETFQMYFPLTYHWDELTHGKAMFMNVAAVTMLVGICYYCYTLDFFVKI